jgi:hypothetical protein
MSERLQEASRRRPDRFLTERWIGLCGFGVVLGYALALGWQMLRHPLSFAPGGKNCLDFIWIWLSGRIAQSSTPVRVYDPVAFSAARVALVGPPDCVLGHFDNPPTILFFTYPLGWLPYWVGFATWMAATLFVYLAAVYAIIPRPVAVVVALTPSPVFWNVLLGHNAFLTAGLMGLALALIERRPLLSGIFLGLLTYKPQFGVLFPFALLASRNWWALFAATAATMIFAAAGAIAFGYQTWPAFIVSLADRTESLTQTPQLTVHLVSVFAVLRSLRVSANFSWAAQLAVAAVVAAVICRLWAQSTPYALRAAAVAMGSLLASPHAFGYDACILMIGVAFFVRDGLTRGFLPLERGVILACWAGLLLLSEPIIALVSISLFILVVRRALRLAGDVVAPQRAGPVAEGPRV